MRWRFLGIIDTHYHESLEWWRTIARHCQTQNRHSKCEGKGKNRRTKTGDKERAKKLQTHSISHFNHERNTKVALCNKNCGTSMTTAGTRFLDVFVRCKHTAATQCGNMHIVHPVTLSLLPSLSSSGLFSVSYPLCSFSHIFLTIKISRIFLVICWQINGFHAHFMWIGYLNKSKSTDLLLKTTPVFDPCSNHSLCQHESFLRTKSQEIKHFSNLFFLRIENNMDGSNSILFTRRFMWIDLIAESIWADERFVSIVQRNVWNILFS